MNWQKSFCLGLREAHLGFGFQRVFEVEVPGEGGKSIKLEASLEPRKDVIFNDLSLLFCSTDGFSMFFYVFLTSLEPLLNSS